MSKPPSDRDPEVYRRFYETVYALVRGHLDEGEPEADIRQVCEEGFAVYDLEALDDGESENVASINSRAIEDAVAGREPCPIWGEIP